MGAIRIGAVAAAFGRDLEASLARVGTLVEHARRESVNLLVLPHAALGGYLTDFTDLDPAELPPALETDGPELRKLADLAGDMVVCVGFCEAGPAGERYNTAACVSGSGLLGLHRKVHLPAGEDRVYGAGNAFGAFDTPLGRLGMLVDYDKTFPESARTLALDGATVIACLSAWPTSITNRAPRMAEDRQSKLFDLYDRSRAAENQVVLVSSNQTGSMGRMRFLGQAKVVGPDGEILARTWAKAGLAVAEVDVEASLGTVRRRLSHLTERRPDAYR
ncbi:carbon-nitrogen hydrolase family protein [Pseudonocardia ailaonensis]|uniref:Carbon-nitrogen hydrolase family protein n=1 Tax=Pseudonocardia ailaonensis TaxID=367279 RepID=A0ABN2NPV4_9PSEU